MDCHHLSPAGPADPPVRFLRGMRTAHADQFSHRLTVPRNCDCFALLQQFKESGKMGLGFVDVDLRQVNVVRLLSRGNTGSSAPVQRLRWPAM